jgi:pectate lyase
MGFGQTKMKPTFFSLIVLLQVSIPCFAEDGFGRNTTGGAGGTKVTITNASDFVTYATSPLPYIITVSGTITLGANVDVASNKTIQGADTAATINADLKIGIGAQNVIVRYLNITNPTGVGDGDGVTIINGARNVIVTHCTFIDYADGMLDITNQSDSVTVSWCRFRYVAQSTHRNVNLVGSNDAYTSDLGYLHVTFHHCWYDQLCNERLPSVRFGRVHVYNNYFSSDSASYCVRTRLYAECLVECNFFENVQNPWELLTTIGMTGKLRAVNNNVSFMETSNGVKWVSGWYPGQSLIPGADTVFVPPYAYSLDSTVSVKTIVMANAGNTGFVDKVKETQGTISGFSLCQNRPNPFNPTTMISFDLPSKSSVLLKVFDLLGREVATIVSEHLTAGYHSRQWNADGLPSGIYFYRLQAGTFTQTKKLVLLR